ncbi:MAG: sulfatase-like hydrolase/transferase, partial [Hyphomicrobiales bacterium]
LSGYDEPETLPYQIALFGPIGADVRQIVPPEGSGMHADEVTIAEVLSEAGYNTAHIGKWHQGDIEQAYPHNQGFDYASFAMHNQAAYGLMTEEAETQRWGMSNSPDANNGSYVLDKSFRPDGWLLALEAEKGGTAREWGINSGEQMGYEHYEAMNVRFQEQALEQLQRMAAEDKPFFLNYWQMKPIDFSRVGMEMQTDNRGSWVESMQVLDGWFGDLLAEVERLGIADNTIVIAMGDNGTMGQGVPTIGFSDMIYRGFKGHTTEGGIRVSAAITWPGFIEPGSKAGDMFHVSDLFTTLANIAGATQYIPTDRVIDGIDQTKLLLDGDANGRRDFLHVYDGPRLRATIKNEFKIHWPAPGTAGFKLPVYNLYRDPREEYPLKTEGMWTVAFFGDMLARHVALKETYPDRLETHGVPYGGIDNLRPESEDLVAKYLTAQKLLSAK